MRILFLTNFYLPYGTGGEERSCQQVEAGLRRRGHATLVLTSMHGTGNVPHEADGVRRWLYLEMDLQPWLNSLTFFTARAARERHNLRCLERTLAEFRPDIIFIWGMWNLPRSLPALAEARHPERVVYRFATYWPTLPSQHEAYWRAPGRRWYSRLSKQVMGRAALAMLARERPPVALAFRHAICVSAACRRALVEAGIPVAHARIVHTGIDPQPYVERAAERPAREGEAGLRLLYAGRLVADKGVDTAIWAVAHLVKSRPPHCVQLSVAGTGPADYQDYLRDLVTRLGLSEQVSFLGHVPAPEMPAVLARHEVLLIPSIWPEPFSRMLLEGMASGLAIVATPTGGTTEIVRDGENGLLFAPGQPEALAEKVARLADEPGLHRRLVQAGWETLTTRFTEARLLDEVEQYLTTVARTAMEAGA